MTENNSFQSRHIGINSDDEKTMLKRIGVSNLDTLISQTIPSEILVSQETGNANIWTEYEALQHMESIASSNQVWKSYIGLGYHPTILPSVIKRNILENPGWYTPYTPYQAEISQGRLEALLNFQTVISDLTGLPIANSSLLDEATAAAEAMHMLYNAASKSKELKDRLHFFVDENAFQTTKDVLYSRAAPFDIQIVEGDPKENAQDEKYFGAFLQNPNSKGEVFDFSSIIEQFHNHGAKVCLGVDILSLLLFKTPGEMNADCAIGNSQRFGVPMGFGGPHAAFFSCKEEFLRLAPGRIIGVSIDAQEQMALRMTLQTREQHIKRQRATSNICTAQALLASMASMYAVWHGPKGLKEIANQIFSFTSLLKEELQSQGFSIINQSHFDTLRLSTDGMNAIKKRAEEKQINLYYPDSNTISISLNETTSLQDVEELFEVLTGKKKTLSKKQFQVPEDKQREDEDYLSHPVFHSYHSETEMMRYMKFLENKDISLVHSMIPLGSCTMKLNAATELFPLTWPAFSEIHPLAPQSQTSGYRLLIDELGKDLAQITGLTATSFQPNSGAQGEYTGLMIIRAYHEDHGQSNRKKMIIPSSAHGTNPASAVMAGFDVVVVDINEDGSINIEDLIKNVEASSDELAGIMITYPSTNGIFDTDIKEICELIHKHGGLVYLDGANMNAQIGYTNPGIIGADVCHLNLHKTFAIPHGGGGPGMGPICVNDRLKPYLPNHSFVPQTNTPKGIKAVSNAPFGSASILTISYLYIKMLGQKGLKDVSAIAILSANYLAECLSDDYDILYRGHDGRVAHEFIIDLRPFKKSVGIDAEDVAKRLMDYGFHAPTMSWPVPGTIMIEPTESESKQELDRFVEAMKGIRKEIQEIEDGLYPKDDNVLVHSPHTMQIIGGNEWNRSYDREKAAFPTFSTRVKKFWPSVSRVNNSYGDRNVLCVCPPIEAYRDDMLVD